MRAPFVGFFRRQCFQKEGKGSGAKRLAARCSWGLALLDVQWLFDDSESAGCADVEESSLTLPVSRFLFFFPFSTISPFPSRSLPDPCFPPSLRNNPPPPHIP